MNLEEARNVLVQYRNDCIYDNYKMSDVTDIRTAIDIAIKVLTEKIENNEEINLQSNISEQQLNLPF